MPFSSRIWFLSSFCAFSSYILKFPIANLAYVYKWTDTKKRVLQISHVIVEFIPSNWYIFPIMKRRVS